MNLSSIFSFFSKYFIYLFLERGREGEREGEKHQCVVVSHVPTTGDLACNPGMCPGWESTCNVLIHRLTLSPLSYTSQGHFFSLKIHIPLSPEKN